MSRTYLITGYPGFIGKRIARHVMREDPDSRLFLVVQPRFLKDAQEEIGRLGRPGVEVLGGDVVDMHLGLSGQEYARLASEVTDIFHLAAVSDLSASRETTQRVN